MTKRDLRIVFMGTPDFALASLKALIDAGYNIVGVITAPDKPAGRGQKLQQSAVKVYAVEKGLEVLQPINLKDEVFLNTLRSLKANLQIVVAFRMLPEAVWRMPQYGTFNLHASLLPQYRGAAPIHWAIINGETKTGVTTFFIDEKIDTGAIIASKSVNIAPDETVGMLHDQLMTLGSQLVLETVELIENNKVQTTIQPASAELKTAYKLNKDNCKIDWEADIDTIYNKIRGLNPFPSAWTTLHNSDEKLDIKIFDIEKELTQHQKTIGTVLTNKSNLKIAVKGGYIIIKTIQFPGKKKMDVQALLNGYKFYDEAFVR
ncbi:methionyl-tRNA formyltransferase [Paucihalobacter ruber]|uniref:Methionyl-tRNA formyltransferase n=1 Tax=Paucihalobacter ruber TaxID=2567861 RepID=A0A506PH73_9FLAO|nr:methionyl-tRNA formyltransferase [Paucihalobacter ruber]TPV33186.1 methionyl-tRNA formyltransferase [Paucihalobacter ruber]